MHADTTRRERLRLLDLQRVPPVEPVHDPDPSEPGRRRPVDPPGAEDLVWTHEVEDEAA
jgi:hypothetical protein